MSDGNEKLYDFKGMSDLTALECKDASRTIQSDAIDADINVIVERYGVTGMLPNNVRIPEYADYEDVFDFRTAQQALIDGENAFMALPAKIRAQFENSPQQFLEFCADPANLDEMRSMGLAVPVEVAEVPPATPQDPPATPQE